MGGRLRSRDDILACATRKALLDAIRASPGVGATDLGRRFGFTRNGVMHHVDVLGRLGLVHVVRCNGKAFLFPPGAAPAARPARLARAYERARPLLEGLARAPEGLTRESMHELLGEDAPRRSRNHLIGRLVALGVVRSAGEGDRFVLAGEDRGNARQEPISTRAGSMA